MRERSSLGPVEDPELRKEGLSREWSSESELLLILMGRLLKANPEIRTARSAWAAAMETAGTGSAWDDPVLGFGWTMLAGRRPAYGGMVSLSQSIPAGGRVGKASRLLEEKARTASVELRSIEIEKAVMLRETFLKALVSRHAVSVAMQNLAWARKGVSLARRIAAAGGASAVDVHVLETEERASRLALLEAEDVHSGDLDALAGLLNLEASALPEIPETSSPVPPRPAFDRSAIHSILSESSPALARAAAAHSEACARVASEQAAAFPDIEAGFEAETEPETGEVFLGMPFSVAIPFWNANSTAIAEAKGDVTRARAAYKAAFDAALAASCSAVSAADRIEKRLAVMEGEILPAHREAISNAMTALESSDFDPLRYVELERALRILEQGRCAILREIAEKRAALEMLAGRPLFPMPGSTPGREVK